MPIKTNVDIDELGAINTMAGYVGIPPIQNISEVNTEPDMKLALQVLKSNTLAILSQGLPCNKDINYPLDQVNGALEVIEPLGSLSCVPNDNNFVVRDGKIYDLCNREFTTKTTLKADIVWNMEFQPLPELVKRYITVVASRAFVARIKGDAAALQVTIPDERRLSAEFQRYAYADTDTSMLHSEMALDIAFRPTYYRSYR